MHINAIDRIHVVKKKLLQIIYPKDMSPLVFGIQSDITQDFVSAKAASLRLSGILNGIDDCWDPAVDPDVAGILGKPCRSEVARFGSFSN